MSINTIDKLRMMMHDAGAQRLYVKELSPNDNSKNQAYLGGDFSVLNILPFGEVRSDAGGKTPNFKAALQFYWLLDDGSLEHSMHAQFILYPKYPEVRLSGFLRGCRRSPGHVMNSRQEGRLLFLGTTGDGRIIGHATTRDTLLARSFSGLRNLPQLGVFKELILDRNEPDMRQLLISELGRIHRLGWISSKKLIAPGKFGPCRAPHCGGMTLEAELGIMPNGYSEPDFHGWEVKQNAVTKLDGAHGGVATLMTPEPTAGYYREEGVEAFLRKYGYPDKSGKPDRINFGGIHKVGERQTGTGLTMILDGFNLDTGKIENPAGGIVLRDDGENNAAEWKFTHIVKHWRRKHARAVYVPSIKRIEPLQYSYGKKVLLGVGTDPLLLLKALAKQAVYYDPGMKLENSSGPGATTKRRSQFRVRMKNIDCLYTTMEQVDVSE
jgi:hypothetical protein